MSVSGSLDRRDVHARVPAEGVVGPRQSQRCRCSRRPQGRRPPKSSMLNVRGCRSRPSCPLEADKRVVPARPVDAERRERGDAIRGRRAGRSPPSVPPLGFAPIAMVTERPDVATRLPERVDYLDRHWWTGRVIWSAGDRLIDRLHSRGWRRGSAASIRRRRLSQVALREVDVEVVAGRAAEVVRLLRDRERPM